MRCDVLPTSLTSARLAGSKTYFTGRPCKRGHIAERLSSCGNCIECQRIANQLHDPEEMKLRDRARYQRNRSEAIDYARRYRLENHEEVIFRMRRWRENNPEKAREAYSRWKLQNPEKARAWKKNNPEAARAIVRNYRAKKRAGGAHSASDVERIRSAQKGRCAICRGKLGAKYHVDHIIPVSRGGSNLPRNLQILCQPCNLTKSGRDPIEFMRSKGKLL